MNPEAMERDVPTTTRLQVISPGNDQIFEKWVALREGFVKKKGWHVEQELDAYDDDPQTQHVVAIRDREIVAGLRLTPFESVEDTLSWSMLTPEMKENAKAHLPESQGVENTWDLTRLVISPDITSRDEATALYLQILGAGLVQTSLPTSSDPRWFFTTTEPLFRFFGRLDIDFTLIADGRINPGDRSKSVFCYADPAMKRMEWAERARRGNNPKDVHVSTGMAQAVLGNWGI